MEEQVIDAIMDAMAKVHEEKQKQPNQFIVVYKQKKDDLIIGYHLSTFCQITDDLLRAKRYSGDPIEQMKIIWKNFSYMMSLTEEQCEDKPFTQLSYNIKMEHFKDIKVEDVYIDTIPLADGTPTQGFTAAIINPKDENK